MQDVYIAAVPGVPSSAVALVIALRNSRRETEREAEARKHAMEMQETRLRAQLRTEFMAEEAIVRLLRHRNCSKRSFEAIQARIGGFGDDELRRLLVRAGAVRFGNGKGEEFWGLRDRNDEELER